ncbi:MAG: membrane protein insertase YidC [Puniceicoccales bacterium]|jgi:YidC/Oxa1 family membrane protein insertase|nr:membrane protein insertase YidC [Puniceicoccales bacterium]
MKDRSQIIGVLLICCALLLLFNGGGNRTETAVSRSPAAEEVAEDLSDGDEIFAEDVPVAAANDPVAGEKLFTLENDVLAVTISDAGGAIRSAALKKYPLLQNEAMPVVFNDGSQIDALAFAIGKWKPSEFSRSEKFDVTAASENAVELSRDCGGYTIRRKYSIRRSDGKNSNGYVVIHETTVANNSEVPVKLGNLSLFLGVMPATESDIIGDYLNFGTFNGKNDNFIKLRDFKGSRGFFGFGRKDARRHIVGSESVTWGSVKNQFFAAVLTPDIPADGYATWPVSIVDSGGEKKDGVAASLTFNVGTLAKGEKKSLRSQFYVGPKDFSRLSSLGKEQDRVMQFGFCGSISELLLRMMLWIHSIVPNWGWTIIILTTLVKLLLWPLTNAQIRSSKKMSAVQRPLREIKEKFKNNPKKMQAETLKLFKENGINPAAGCFPILIQIPIFFGLYYMLRTASDLRFAHFLWIRDLSLPDTVARVGSFPLNILPLVMGVTMFWQMHMMPSPTTDGSQKIMFKLLPAIFLLFCYNLPSGLVLYWTVQNLLTIIQQSTSSKRACAQAVAPIAENSVTSGTVRRSRRKTRRK